MPAPKNPNGGRPAKKIDYEQVARLAGVGFSKRQIATVLDMDEEYMLTRATKDEELRRALSGAKDKLLYRDWETDRKSTRLNSSHSAKSRMPSSA